MPLLMKKGAFADWMGVKPSAVSNWGKKNLLVFAPDPENPDRQLVDAEKSRAVIRATVDPTRGRPRARERQAVDGPEGSSPPPPPSNAPIALNGLEAARLDEMRERTIGRRIENEKAAGRLVPLAEYERRTGDMGRLVRERTTGLVRQLAERLASETDPRQVQAILSEAFDKMFNQLADEIEASADEEQAADAALAQIAEADGEDEDDPDLAPAAA